MITPLAVVSSCIGWVNCGCHTATLVVRLTTTITIIRVTERRARLFYSVVVVHVVVDFVVVVVVFVGKLFAACFELVEKLLVDQKRILVVVVHVGRLCWGFDWGCGGSLVIALIVVVACETIALRMGLVATALMTWLVRLAAHSSLFIDIPVDCRLCEEMLQK